MTWAAVLIGVWCQPIWAQEQPPERGRTPEMMLADQLVMLARASLGADQEPRSDQLYRAGVLIDHALGLTPNDGELWRLRMELAARAGEKDRELEALRRYCKLHPDDDAAQFDLILQLLSKHQHLEQRVAAAQRVLDGKASHRLSKPFRSRLAFYVAKGSLETFDQPRFNQRLTEALELDPTNTHAAQMNYQWRVQQGASVQAISQALAQLVMANPIDALVRRELADLLVTLGAYEQAAKQYQVAQSLASEPANESMVFNWVLCLAATGQIQDALQLLDQYESFVREQAPQPADPDDSRADTGLGIDMEQLRLVILHRSDQSARAQASFERIDRWLHDRIQSGDSQAKTERVWLTVMFGTPVPPADILDQANGRGAGYASLLARIAGWVHLRRGNDQAAQEAFEHVAAGDPFAAYGLAQLDRLPESDQQQYQAQLQHTVHMAPRSLAALMAAYDLTLERIKSTPTEDGVELVQQIQHWPLRLALPNPIRSPWSLLSAKVQPMRSGYLQPITAQIVLRNLTEFPLSLGPHSSLPSSLLVYLSPQRSAQTTDQGAPIVVDMGRRLQLGPRESVAVDVRLDRSDWGITLTSNPWATIRSSATAILGPQWNANGQVMPELLGATESIRLFERLGSEANIDELVDTLSDPDPVKRLYAVAMLGRIDSRPGETADPQALAQRVGAAVRTCFQGLNEVGQAWVIRFMLANRQGRDWFGNVDELAQRSDSLIVWITYLATQVHEPESVAMNTALRHSNPLVVKFANAQRTGLLELAKQEALTSNADPDNL